MTRLGAGDRWLAGEPLDGVAFGHHASVCIMRGAHDGCVGRVTLLMSLGDDPLYLVTLGDGTDIRVRQSALSASR
ncbi:MAG: hypothetical protein H0W68_05455 [Gemmatimonadaceae bacterium]|nr:hypothetical protein [Gemmatimonadaceae bacterium]